MKQKQRILCLCPITVSYIYVKSTRAVNFFNYNKRINMRGAMTVHKDDKERL